MNTQKLQCEITPAETETRPLSEWLVMQITFSYNSNNIHFQCVDGYPYLNRCPSGLYFDDISKFCTFKAEARCGPIATSKYTMFIYQPYFTFEASTKRKLKVKSWFMVASQSHYVIL